jgi:hypothetical protein
MQMMVRNEPEILARVGGVSGDFGGQRHFFTDDQNIKKRNCIA